MPSTITRALAILVTMLVVTLHDGAAEPAVRKLSLKECVSIAMENATSVRKAGNNLKLEGADVLKSYGSFLPKLTSTASYVPRSVSQSYNSTTYGTTPGSKVKTESRSLGLGITASLNLFNGLSDYAALQSALDLEGAAGLSLRRAKETVVFDVTQHYYQALLDQELLGIARGNLLSTNDLLTLVDRQYRIGIKSLADLYQQQAEVAGNALTVIRAENQSRKSRLELLRRLRLDPLTDISLEPADTTRAESLSPAVDIAGLAAESLKNRADLEAGRLQSDAARWQVRGAAGSRLPKLDLAVSANSNGIDAYRMTTGSTSIDYPYPPLGTQLANGIGYAVSLNLSWAIFDGFQTRYAVQAAKSSWLNRQLDYEELKDGIVLDLQQAAGDYRAAFTQIAASRASLLAATSAFNAVQRKYELGASGFVELSNARATLFNARSNMTQASYNLALQKALLDYTSGRSGLGQLDNASPSTP
ncbi:MAG: TolC family protein [Chlorobiaceae bacterium]|nr:TolC family protein [Chlorobiaceae bacterium]